jgi:flagellar capping protein FliD
MDDATIKAKLQDFADKYNAWIERFDPTVGTNGLLAGTQAAEISLYELEQSVENIFNGAASGFRGLNDLGFSIDPYSNLLSIDLAELDAALAKSKNGALDTVQQFAANFAKSAELLNSSNNFIPNRLNNLDRVIDYITDNKTSLQAEFGLGDAARPSAEVSKALAVYNKIYAS